MGGDTLGIFSLVLVVDKRLVVSVMSGEVVKYRTSARCQLHWFQVGICSCNQ